MTFYDKALRIEYAKTKSYATLKRENPDYVPPSVLKAQSHPAPASMLAKRNREGDFRGGSSKKRNINGVGAGTAAMDEDEEMEIEQDEDDEMPNHTNGATTTNGVPPPPISTSNLPAQHPTPNLLCSNLPVEVTDDVLAVLFQQYRGFQTTHTSAGPPDASGTPTKMARVVFDSAELASVAREALDGFALKKGWQMGVQFS